MDVIEGRSFAKTIFFSGEIVTLKRASVCENNLRTLLDARICPSSALSVPFAEKVVFSDFFNRTAVAFILP
jgi:hypothetical protein